MGPIVTACLDYNAKVSQYWLEFEEHDTKQGTLLKDVLRHEAGLPVLADAVSIEDSQRDAVKKNSIGSIVEKSSVGLLVSESEACK